MSEVNKRRMIYLKVEPKRSHSPPELIEQVYHESCNNVASDYSSANEEPEILYNFDSEDELNDNPLKFSRSPSPASSSQSCKSNNGIFKLKEELQMIANDPTTCTTTMNKILEVMHNYFPWLPDYIDELKFKTDKTDPNIQSDGNIQHVLIEKKEIDGIKKNIEIIMNGQIALMKEFKSFRSYRTKIGIIENAKFELPFNDLEVFMKFDKELRKDQETKDQLIRIYMKEVENDPRKYIKKNLRKLFTPDLAIKFSFRGRQGNISAGKSNTIQILRDCTDQLYSQFTQDLFERCASHYFYYVKDKSKVSKRNHISDVNTVEFVLPFNEIDLFKSFDGSLVKDPELAQQLKLMYLEENVLEYKRFILNNFKKIFTNELANQFCFTGKGGLCIRDFNIIKIMKNCFLEKYNETNETHFYNCAKQYLIYVKQKITLTNKN